jgi:hypothetical protein
MALLSSRVMLDNAVIFGTVNASRKNHQQAVDADEVWSSTSASDEQTKGNASG